MRLPTTLVLLAALLALACSFSTTGCGAGRSARVGLIQAEVAAKVAMKRTLRRAVQIGGTAADVGLKYGVSAAAAANGIPF